MNLGIAIVLSVLASVAFAVAAVLQHEAVGRGVREESDTRAKKRAETQTDKRAETLAGHLPSGRTRTLGAGFFRRLLQRPLWWIGFGLSGVGALLNLTALSGAPVAVVQPITVLSVPLAVVVGRWRSRGRTTLGPAVMAAIAAAMTGVTVFVALAAHTTESQAPATSHIILAGLIAAAFIGVVLVLGHRGAPWQHSLSWAAGAAGAYGLAAAYMKAIFVQYAHGVPISSPTIWLPGLVLVVAYPAAAYMLQHAFIFGAPAVAIGGLTVIDPIMAVLLGAFLLGEGTHVPVTTAVIMIGAAVLAVTGIIVLSRYHPEADRATPEPPVPSSTPDLPLPHGEAVPAEPKGSTR